MFTTIAILVPILTFVFIVVLTTMLGSLGIKAVASREDR